METATNPETGETVVLVGSEWKPAEKVATNPEGKKAYLVGGQWVGDFKSTPGNAAVGNPNIMRQGDKALRNGGDLMPAYKVGTAGATGGILGALSPEILTVLGAGASAFPATAPAAPFLLSAGSTLRAQRGLAAAAGAISGLAGESAGQVAELAGAGPTTAEAARIVAGGITPEFKALTGYAIKHAAGLPVVSDLVDAVKKYIGKDVKLSVEQERYLAEQAAQLRGGPKTDAPLEAVGNALEEAGSKGLVQSARAATAANRQAAQVGRIAPLPEREVSVIGGDLRDVILARNEAALQARAKAYKDTEVIRDTIVRQREANNVFVSSVPEYKQLVDDLTAQLNPGVRAPSVQAGIKKILSEIEAPNTSFQALDDVRRKLGDAFRGKPAEGYDAIGEGLAKRLYERVSEIQKRYAGKAQEKLLDDYAAATEGMSVFRSKSGKKATALDSFDRSQFDTDAAALPRSYFKTQASVQALKELTGDSGLVNRSAIQYANRELRDATGPEVRAWLGKNSDWLKELPAVRGMVDNYATKLEAAERSTRQAAAFADDAARTNSALLGSGYPAQRVKQLVESGNADLWRKAGPAIGASTEGRTNILAAVRQVLADKPVTPDFFARSIRPALEESRLADKQALDFIAQKLDAIQKLNVPQEQKLGIARRVLLQAVGGYTASGTARGAVEAANRVPE